MLNDDLSLKKEYLDYIKDFFNLKISAQKINPLIIDEMSINCLKNQWIKLYIKLNYLKNLHYAINRYYLELNKNSKTLINQIKKLKDKRLLALTLYLNALNYSKIKIYNKALEYYSQALTIYKELSNNLLIIKCLRRIALINLKQKDFINAYRNLNQAEQICNDHKYHIEKARILFDLSSLSMEIAYHDKAIICILEAQDTLLRNGKIKAYIMCQIRLALIYKSLNKLEKSTKSFFEAEKYALLIKNINLLSECYYYLGDLYLSNKEPNLAFIYLTKSRDLLENNTNKTLKLLVFLKLSEYYRLNMEYKKSTALLKKAYLIVKKTKNFDMISEIYLKLAFILLELKNEKKSILLAEKALKILKQNPLASLDKVYFFYYEYFKSRKMFRDAYENYQLYIHENEKKKNTEIAKNLNQMQIHFEIDQLKRRYDTEIEIQKADTAFALAVTANHEINQPLMIIQGNLDIINHKLGSQNISPDQKNRLLQASKNIEDIEIVLTNFRKHTNDQLKLNKHFDEVVIK